MGGLGPEILVVLGVLVVLFGGSQLPKFARSLGEAKRELQDATAEPRAEQAAP